MPRKKKSYRRKKTVPLAPLLGATMPLLDAGLYAYKTHGIERVPAALLSKITGYDIVNQDFSMQRLLSFLTPFLIGVAVHKIAGFTGLNRILGRAGVPIIRI